MVFMFVIDPATGHFNLIRSVLFTVLQKRSKPKELTN